MRETTEMNTRKMAQNENLRVDKKREKFTVERMFSLFAYFISRIEVQNKSPFRKTQFLLSYEHWGCK